eukprot:GHVN01073884.1.p1 GENE.GHVN01073884.1~~GHVN01073884.1.p1  ORF type:complete len:1126 (-),score=130.79 GHVN01073884.1:40-3417(-)
MNVNMENMLLGHGGRNTYSSVPQNDGSVAALGPRAVYAGASGYAGNVAGMHGNMPSQVPMGMVSNQSAPQYNMNNMVPGPVSPVQLPLGGPVPTPNIGPQSGMTNQNIGHNDQMMSMGDGQQWMERDRMDNEQRGGDAATPPSGHHSSSHTPKLHTMPQIKQNLRHYLKWFQAGTPLRCLLPDNTIGLVMGPGGRTIKSISQETGGMIQVLNDYEKPPSIQDAICIVYGPNDQSKEDTLIRVCEQAEKKLELRDKEGASQLFTLVPLPAVGAMMGKEGRNIQEIGNQSGCKLKVMEVHAYHDKIVSILGPTIKEIAKAIILVNNKVQETFEAGKLSEIDFVYHLKAAEQKIVRQGGSSAGGGASGGYERGDRAMDGGGGRSVANEPMGRDGSGLVGSVDLPTAKSKVADCEETSNVVLTFIISKPQAGWIIGVQGQHRRSIEYTTRAQVQVLNEAKPQISPQQPDDRTLEISGTPIHKCEAICFILKGYDEKRQKETGRDTATEVAVRMVIPQRTLKHIIGKEGATINQLQMESGAHIQVNKNLVYQNVEDRLVEISGSTESKMVAVLLIQQKLESLDKPPPNPMAGTSRTENTRPPSAGHVGQGHRLPGPGGGQTLRDRDSCHHLRGISSSPRHSSQGPDKKRRKGGSSFGDVPALHLDRDMGRHERDRDDRRDRERERERERERDTPYHSKEPRIDDRDRRYGRESMPPLRLPASRGARSADHSASSREDNNAATPRDEIPSEAHFLNIAQTLSFPRIITCQETIHMEISFSSQFKDLTQRYGTHENLVSMISDRTGASLSFLDSEEELRVSVKGSPIGTCTAILLLQEHFIDTAAYDADHKQATDLEASQARAKTTQFYDSQGGDSASRIRDQDETSRLASPQSERVGQQDVEEGELDGVTVSSHSEDQRPNDLCSEMASNGPSPFSSVNDANVEPVQQSQPCTDAMRTGDVSEEAYKVEPVTPTAAPTAVDSADATNMKSSDSEPAANSFPQGEAETATPNRLMATNPPQSLPPGDAVPPTSQTHPYTVLPLQQEESPSPRSDAATITSGEVSAGTLTQLTSQKLSYPFPSVAGTPPFNDVGPTMPMLATTKSEETSCVEPHSVNSFNSSSAQSVANNVIN